MRKHGPLPVELVVAIFIQALEGLQHAHKKEILHRDIKPANMMLTPEGTLKLMDFGIAKIANEQRMTQVNKLVGTIEYMAPELIEGKDASPASDIYAMGITLYELVSGKLPFEHDTDYSLMQAVLKNKPVAPEKFNPRIPRALSEIILKAIEKKPADRYGSAKEFQFALMRAFPNYREINMDLLPTATASENSQQLLAATRVETVLQETRLASSIKPISSYLPGKTFFAKNKTPVVIGAVGLIIFLIFIFSIFNKSSEGGIAQSKGNSTDTVVKRDSPQLSVNKPPQLEVVPETVAKPIEVKERTDSNLVPINVNNNENAGKKTKKKEEVVEKRKKNDEVSTPEENKEPPKPVEKKEVYIDSRVEVNLYLRDEINTSDGERDHTVTFTVSNAVVYKGVTIIKQGAIANGSIRVGRVMTDININSVMAANGQQLELKADRKHRRRSELGSDRNYTAIVEQGVTIKE